MHQLITYSMFTFLLFTACSNEKTDSIANFHKPLDYTYPDQASGQHYVCNGSINFETIFVGPDTMKVKILDSDYIVTLDRSASGAKYSGDGITFWNKGSESRLLINVNNYRCQKLAKQL